MSLIETEKYFLVNYTMKLANFNRLPNCSQANRIESNRTELNTSSSRQTALELFDNFCVFFVRGSFIKKKMLRKKCYEKMLQKSVTKKCYVKRVTNKVLRITRLVQIGKGFSKYFI